MRIVLAGVDREVAGMGAGQAELAGRCWGVPLSLVEDAAVLAVLVAGRDYRVYVCGRRGEGERGGGGGGTMFNVPSKHTCITIYHV